MSALVEDDPLMIDVVSDVVCPWCFIGKRRLEKAVAAAGTPIAIRWRPFQLDPTIPPQGKDRRVYLEQKFGSKERIRKMHENVAAAGASEGIPFAFDRIAISPNTINAHRLIRWAADAPSQGRLVESLFRAYFLEGRNVGDGEVLSEIGWGHGMDRAIISARLASDEDRDAVRAEIEDAQRIGVTGVPTFIIDRRYALVGAQPAEELVAAIRQVSAARAGNVPTAQAS